MRCAMKIVIMAAVALFSSTGLLAGTDYYGLLLMLK